MTEAPEPTDKLDTMANVMVNGPEDGNLDWGAVDWRACEESVRRLRQRIFTASKAGDLVVLCYCSAGCGSHSSARSTGC
jgi:RNA-directed DNA polymerase